MRRLTTPEHGFTLNGVPADSIDKIVVTYCQNDEIILEKTGDDFTFDNNTAITVLSQAETKLFDDRKRIELQVRVITTQGKSLVSNIIEDDCLRVLNDEVL